MQIKLYATKLLPEFQYDWILGSMVIKYQQGCYRIMHLLFPVGHPLHGYEVNRSVCPPLEIYVNSFSRCFMKYGRPFCVDAWLVSFVLWGPEAATRGLEEKVTKYVEKLMAEVS